MTSALNSLVAQAIEDNTPTTNLLASGLRALVVPGLPGRHNLALEAQDPSLRGQEVDNSVLISRVDQHTVVALGDQYLVVGDDGAGVEIVLGSTALLPVNGLDVKSRLNSSLIQPRGDMVINAGVLVWHVALLGSAHAIDERMRETDVLEQALSIANIIQDIIGLAEETLSEKIIRREWLAYINVSMNVVLVVIIQSKQTVSLAKKQGKTNGS